MDRNNKLGRRHRRRRCHRRCRRHRRCRSQLPGAFVDDNFNGLVIFRRHKIKVETKISSNSSACFTYLIECKNK